MQECKAIHCLMGEGNMNESKRKKRTELLREELYYFELDEIAKIVATQVPVKMLFRIINKLRRLRGKERESISGSNVSLV